MAYTPPNPNGATTAANSAPVAVATDQLSTLSTVAAQNTGNSSLATVATNTGRLPAQGAAATSASLPVNVASDQILPIGGSVAAGVADTGNPVKMGGKYNNSLPTLTDGNRGDLQLGQNGALRVELWGSSANTSINRDNDNSDAVATTGTADSLRVSTRPRVYNGTTWDRPRIAVGDAQAATGLTAAAEMQYNGTTFDRVRTVVGATSAGTGITAVGPVPTAVSLGLTSFQNTAVSTTLVTVKASAGRLHRITVQNPNTSIAWLQIFNTTTVTLGTTVPVMSIPVPQSGIFEDFYMYSDTFSAAIAIAATTTPTGATANTTALFVSLGYI